MFKRIANGTMALATACGVVLYLAIQNTIGNAVSTFLVENLAALIGVPAATITTSVAMAIVPVIIGIAIFYVGRNTAPRIEIGKLEDALCPNMKVSDAIDYIVNDSVAKLQKVSSRRPESFGNVARGTAITIFGVEHEEARSQLNSKLNTGELKSWGLRQINTHIPNQFEHSLREIPKSYWNEMQLDFVTCLDYRGPFSQTTKIPGKTGEFNYADINVCKAQVGDFWPKKSLAVRIWTRIACRPRIRHVKGIHIAE